MLPRPRRLSRKDFLAAKSHGKSTRTPHFSLLTCSNNLSFSRFSIITSTKLHKSAVVRNRLRRQIYDQLSTISHQPSADIIIIPHHSMLNLPRAEIGPLLNQALSKITPGIS
ncbi:ribonuclease P protein component [Candidatus Amesbacteria bacterium RIFCSPHIGHO2_02_FULL_47_9]|uniref:Ribonuclease P protein component n=1 Tax=Candidatus Amesbacteria bacterium RIFCSPHIGHO2_01_FULL_48_32b TaxID=1797253 RepID=A0A1F4YGR9_9BACT|nr:MAG: ribonuclease P protein component [Candidatus Amesbacteria bacterium RIFCSPHIGHO2_01_FULL_48_32b]OGD03532.1 MAG: ribonuclease P protein component [Candidatus Amesbacteria bacterium RIFCSPHIGHO2_02_FULL_47_9]OGD07392.1 MAG: ribonuclease P protein component [Candidatus Amesbacteria bacterium RIFCSPLOWO2_01_FULL_49_25]